MKDFGLHGLGTAESTAGGKSRVVIARSERLRAGSGTLDSDRLLAVLDRSVQSFFDRDNAIEAWRMIVRIRAATGDASGARAALAEALRANASNELLLSLREQLEGSNPH